MTKTARVFIPQHPSKFNPTTGERENDGDLSGVMAFGHPVFMLPQGRLRYGRIHRRVVWMRKAMFDYTKDDYLMMVGDPAVIAAAFFIAATKAQGPVNVIRWMRQTNEFKVFPLDMGAGQ